jgi:hypothetical protein
MSPRDETMNGGNDAPLGRKFSRRKFLLSSFGAGIALTTAGGLLDKVGSGGLRQALAQQLGAPPVTAPDFRLDNVRLSVTSPFLPGPQRFQASEEGDISQIASCFVDEPLMEAFTITAAPYNVPKNGLVFAVAPATEAVPTPHAGGAAEYLAALRAAHIDAKTLPNPPDALLFTQLMPGNALLTDLKLSADPDIATPGVVVEWVGDAGERLWIVRIVKQLDKGEDDLATAASFVASLTGIIIVSVVGEPRNDHGIVALPPGRGSTSQVNTAGNPSTLGSAPEMGPPTGGPATPATPTPTRPGPTRPTPPREIPDQPEPDEPEPFDPLDKRNPRGRDPQTPAAATIIGLSSPQSAAEVTDDTWYSGDTSTKHPRPFWWSSDDDGDRYFEQTNHLFRPVAINDGYQGVRPIRPRPGINADHPQWRNPDGTTRLDVLSNSMPGGDDPPHRLWEWECVEYVMRYMILAYGVKHYHGDGVDIVRNYRPAYGGDLHSHENRAGSRRAPQPGNVLSYNLGDTFGHTNLCVSTNVNSDGNGWIICYEQNASAAGKKRVRIQNWKVVAGIDSSDPKRSQGWLYRITPGGVENYGACSYCDETQLFIEGPFQKLYWKPGLSHRPLSLTNTQDQVLQMFGRPISKELAETADYNGKIKQIKVQYFERARMEIVDGTVRIGGLGSLYATKTGGLPSGTRTGSASARHFVTDHYVGGAFLELYERIGRESGLGEVAVCGYPITDEVRETDTDGSEYFVQYFENVMMVWFPNLSDSQAYFGKLGRRFRNS